MANVAADLAPFQGRWRIETLEVGGMTMPAGMLAAAEVRVDGDQFLSLGMGAEYRGTMSVEANTAAGEPTLIAIAFAAGPETGNINRALVDIAGDRWRMCLDMKGGPAPAAFATSAADGYALQALRRA